jgi:hypothetical protein
MSNELSQASINYFVNADRALQTYGTTLTGFKSHL